MHDISVDTAEGPFTFRAAALIIDDEKLLVAKHKDYPCFYTVGGKVKINETSEEAVVREAFEETGINFQIDRLAFVQERFFELSGRKHHELVFFYFMKTDHPINILESAFSDQGGNETLHWLPVHDLEQYTIVPEFLKYKLSVNADHIIHIVSKDS